MLPLYIETMKSMQKDDAEAWIRARRANRISRPRRPKNESAMGDAFNDSHNDEHVLPAAGDLRQQRTFKRGMGNFNLPQTADVVRFIISHEQDRLQPADGINRIDAIKRRHPGSDQGHAVGGIKVHLVDTVSTFKDMQEGNAYDLIIAGAAALDS